MARSENPSLLKSPARRGPLIGMFVGSAMVPDPYHTLIPYTSSSTDPEVIVATARSALPSPSKSGEADPLGDPVGVAVAEAGEGTGEVAPAYEVGPEGVAAGAQPVRSIT